jgi:hypothetical protein
MSIEVMTLVWKNFNRGGSEKLAMLALADWCNDQGGNLYPSISSIAKKINVSESQARRIIHGFISEGLLSVVANHDGGDPGKSRHYKLNVEILRTPGMYATPGADATPCMDARYPLHGCALPLAPMRVTPSAHDTLTTINHHINTREPSLSKKNDIRSFMSDVTDQTFFDFKELRKAKKSPITQRAIEGIRREAQKAGITLENALIECCERGWVGFKAEWYINSTMQQARASPKSINKAEALLQNNLNVARNWKPPELRCENES